jgi:hypothetical protein
MLCGEKSKIFLEFIKEIEGLKDWDTPDYTRLQFLLMKCMISVGQEMDSKFDWSVEIAIPTNEMTSDEYELSQSKSDLSSVIGIEDVEDPIMIAHKNIQRKLKIIQKFSD